MNLIDYEQFLNWIKNDKNVRRFPEARWINHNPEWDFSVYKCENADNIENSLVDVLQIDSDDTSIICGYIIGKLLELRTEVGNDSNLRSNEVGEIPDDIYVF